MARVCFYVSLLLILSCKKSQEKIKPHIQSISESVYASGILKSKNQYQVFATVSGIIENLLVHEGDTIKKGDILFTISNEAQKLNKENAELSASYSDYAANLGKLDEARQNIELSKIKLNNDSALYARQSSLWQQGIGTKMDLELRELNYKNSMAALAVSRIRYNDLQRQLSFVSAQSKKNLKISAKQQNDYTIRSEINGVVYSINVVKGDLITPQIPLAILGDAKKFVLEMQVDEYDIFKINTGFAVWVTLDSYKGKSFEASITRILPLMNERSKTFTVEAEFIDPPPVLYPHITFEANIVTRTKENALLIPRDYLQNDTVVTTIHKEKINVKTGLKDYRNVEILQGITTEDELIKPKQ
jgi:multidrug efflux pump subunit AcrA (membrane-fusion protein)